MCVCFCQLPVFTISLKINDPFEVFRKRLLEFSWQRYFIVSASKSLCKDFLLTVVWDDFFFLIHLFSENVNNWVHRFMQGFSIRHLNVDRVPSLSPTPAAISSFIVGGQGYQIWATSGSRADFLLWISIFIYLFSL